MIIVRNSKLILTSTCYFVFLCFDNRKNIHDTELPSLLCLKRTSYLYFLPESYTYIYTIISIFKFGIKSQKKYLQIYCTKHGNREEYKFLRNSKQLQHEGANFLSNHIEALAYNQSQKVDPTSDLDKKKRRQFPKKHFRGKKEKIFGKIMQYFTIGHI